MRNDFANAIVNFYNVKSDNGKANNVNENLEISKKIMEECDNTNGMMIRQNKHFIFFHL